MNTRLQVEHPVTEEVTGIDLVREMFRIADGEPLGYDDPPARGHSIEFRINGEDPGRGFLPAPGTITTWRHPVRPGVRVDSGVEAGTVVSQNFDSLLAKLIVTGATRQQALERSRRALAEFEVEGMATALPFHRAVVATRRSRPPTRTQAVHACTPGGSRPSSSTTSPSSARPAARPDEAARETVVVEVGGKRLEVVLPAGLGASNGAAAAIGPLLAGPVAAKTKADASGDALDRPMQGTIVKVAVAEGDTRGRGRPRRRARGDEDGAAAQRPQGRRRSTGLDRRGRRDGRRRHRPLRHQGLLNDVPAR